MRAARPRLVKCVCFQKGLLRRRVAPEAASPSHSDEASLSIVAGPPRAAVPLKERRTIVKKDEKDAGSRRWNAPIVSASCESGCFSLNLRSRDCSYANSVDQLFQRS